MSLTEIKSVPLADRVEKQILKYIHTGKVKPGNPLPSEQEMAEKMNVSRNVVREALSRLRVLGLVESRKKRGLIVTSPNAFEALKRAIHPRVMDEDQSSQLRELRIIIELGLAESLFKNATIQDIKDLEEIVDREKNLEEMPHEERVEVDVEFHKKLYSATGNKALKEFQNILMPFFDEIETQIDPSKLGLPPEITHSELVSILKKGTPEEFRKAMKTHLNKFLDEVGSTQKKRQRQSSK
jgi:DNA-binding FadR family transcriptional regulator